MVSPHKIKFNNKESLELPMDLIMEVAFDGDSGETATYLNREAVAAETHDGRYKSVTRYKYNESFSPKFTFVKKGFSDFTMDEVRSVLKWLTSTSQTALLDVYYKHDDNVKVADWSAIGGWTDISIYKLANNRTVGIVATFEAITPFAMSDLIVKQKKVSSATDNKITIDIDTDDKSSSSFSKSFCSYDFTRSRMSFARDNFDCVCFFGYHTMEGTLGGVLAHTMSSKEVQFYKLDGKYIGKQYLRLQKTPTASRFLLLS